MRCVINNPFIVWGKYKRCFQKKQRLLSHVAHFFDELQKGISVISTK